MALEKCKECGKEISSQAKVCPHCGFKPYRWGWGKKLIAGFVVLWGLGTIVAMMATSGDRSAGQADIDRAKAQRLCKEAIERQLKAPSTAKFSGMLDTRAGKSDKGDWIVAGHVDAHNSYGAMMRSQFQCRIDPRSADWKIVTAKLIE